MFNRYGKEGFPLRTKTMAPGKPGTAVKNLTKVMPAKVILAEEKRLPIVEKVRQQLALDESQYESFALELLHNLAHHCQYLPESSTMYYSQNGGLIDYALNRTDAALMLFEQYLLKNANDTLSDEQKLWQYALYSAALLQGIGKLQVDYSVKLYNQQGEFLKGWNPLLENFLKAPYYSYELEKGDTEELRKRLNLLLAKELMPKKGFTWIASNKDVLAVWLALLNEDFYSAGTLGAILIRADALAIQHYLEHFLDKALIPQNSSNPYGRMGTFAGGQPESAEFEQKAGLQFINWLKDALASKAIMINKAPLLMVPGGMLMNADLFKLFIREHPEFKNWLTVQNGLATLNLHRVDNSAHRNMKADMVLKNFSVVLPERFHQYDEKTGKSSSISAVELIAVSKNMALDASGKWQQHEARDEQLSFKSRLPRSV